MHIFLINFRWILLISELFTYSPTQDDILEEDCLELDGETPPDEDEEDDIPVRTLDDYVVYDLNSFEAIPLANLMAINSGYSTQRFGASGLVDVWIDRDSDDEDSSVSEDDDQEAPQFIRTSTNLERFTLSEINDFSTISPTSRKKSFDK